MAQPNLIEQTRRWISSVVIGLNLCPFALRVFGADLIRYVISEARTEEELADDLRRELRTLAAAHIASVETTVLIHPYVLADFLDYNDFLDVADQILEGFDLDGVIQVASFHPAYQFADTEPDDVQNYTNRSPYPMLHLLREESITALPWATKDLEEIPRRNIETLRGLGRERMLEMLKADRTEPS